MRIAQLFDVSGKTAVVTGATSGIGLMIAHALAVNGVRTYIVSRRPEACERIARLLGESGDCAALPGDLSNESGCARLVERLLAREDRLDILVNNAGTAWSAPVEEFPGAGFDKVMGLNVKAPFLLLQGFLPVLASSASAHDPSRVINIGSADGGRVPALPTYSYSASKAGLHMMTRHLAHHLAPRNITVNAIAPGPFESLMMSPLLNNPTSRAEVESWVPQGRLGTPEDIAGATIFLASRAGSYLTGAVVPVDGGMSTHG